MRHIVITAIAFAGFAIAARASAIQPPTPPVAVIRSDTLRLTLEAAERMALERNGIVLAARARVAGARGDLRQARALGANPEAEFEALNASGQLGGYRSALTQEIEIGGQRGARVAAAAAQLSAVEYLRLDAGRAVQRDVHAAFFRTAAAREQVKVMEQIIGLQNDLLTAVRTQLAEGEISTLEANLAEVELGRSRAKLLTARRLAADAEHELRSLLGLPPQQPIAVITSGRALASAAPETDSLIARAMAERPDLAALRASVTAAERTATLASRAAIPNPTVGILAEREDATGQTQVGFVVGLPIPLWNRNRGATAARTADVTRAQAEVAAADVRIRNEVASAAHAYALAREELEILESAVLVPARENQRLLEIAYREGKSDLPTILLLRNQLLEAELDYLDAWLAARTALANLEAAIGAPLRMDNDSDER
ncbi:MAG TPA: TolC family protein [Thermomicrobiales bacterium]|nr:TolC family protein [Thermomicrobiales bacterium]